MSDRHKTLLVCAAVAAIVLFLLADDLAHAGPPPITRTQLRWYLIGFLDGASPTGFHTDALSCDTTAGGWLCRARIVDAQLGVAECMQGRWNRYGQPLTGWTPIRCGRAAAPSS